MEFEALVFFLNFLLLIFLLSSFLFEELPFSISSSIFLIVSYEWVKYYISFESIIFKRLSFNIGRILANLIFSSFISFVIEVIEVDKFSIEEDILLKPISKSEYRFERSILSFVFSFLSFALISSFKLFFFGSYIFIIFLRRWFLELIFWFSVFFLIIHFIYI